MVGDNTNHGLYRREMMSGMVGVGALTGSASLAPEALEGADEVVEAAQEAPAPDDRITSSARVGPRDFHEENYEIVHMHRRKEAIRTLLADPEVNSIVQNWIASFVGYEPLTNHLDAVSVQGPTDYTVETSDDRSTFDVTAVDRQTIYGLVDRRRNELVALQVNQPIDVSWTESYDEQATRRTDTVLAQPEVQEFLAGKQWWPMEKVAESITAVKDYPHGSATIVILYAVGDDGVSVASGYVDVSGEEPEFIMVHFVDDFVRYPVQEMARGIRPNDETALGSVPTVPTGKRPLKTANNGFHRFQLVPPQSFEQDGWSIEWEPPGTMGVRFAARYNGKPVFAAMNAVATPTGYGLSPREGRNTAEWFFPEAPFPGDERPVFDGHHLFWDIHSIPFGGPGQLGKIDYPARNGHPPGFQFRTHYHTGAQGRSSVDFHSGAQFGPYNYNISYEFFEDGRFVPIWRRHGPGYVHESLTEYPEFNGPDTVVQQYLHMTALDITPATTQGVTTQVFDGDEWVTPETEFYLHEGDPGTKVRFSNPNGPERIDIPMQRDRELVVVRRKSSEIGPSPSQKERVTDMEAELDFYHPAQYVDGDSIQGERVIPWLVVEASMDEVPHPAAVTGYVAQAELNLAGY